jgi:hypothetical protein
VRVDRAPIPIDPTRSELIAADGEDSNPVIVPPPIGRNTLPPIALLKSPLAAAPTTLLETIFTMLLAEMFGALVVTPPIDWRVTLVCEAWTAAPSRLVNPVPIPIERFVNAALAAIGIYGEFVKFVRLPKYANPFGARSEKSI